MEHRYDAEILRTLAALESIAASLDRVAASLEYLPEANESNANRIETKLVDLAGEVRGGLDAIYRRTGS